jgi:hypothetical protein
VLGDGGHKLRKILSLAIAAEDDDGLRPQSSERGDGGADVGALRIVVEGHAADRRHFLDAVRQAAECPQCRQEFDRLEADRGAQRQRGERVRGIVQAGERQCADRQQTLDNFNAPNSLDFVWDPAVCDDVNLTIFFQETSVTLTWQGEWGFRDFLRALRDGREVLVPEQFPRNQAILEGLGIKYIEVKYRIRNAEPILKLEQLPALKVPDEAASCWSGLGAGESIGREK